MAQKTTVTIESNKREKYLGPSMPQCRSRLSQFHLLGTDELQCRGDRNVILYGKDQVTPKRRTLAYATENFRKLRASVSQKLVQVVEDGLQQQNEFNWRNKHWSTWPFGADEDDGYLILTYMTFSSVESLTLDKPQKAILLLG